MNIIAVAAEVLASMAECAISILFLIRYFGGKKNGAGLATVLFFFLAVMNNVLLSQREGYELVSIVSFFLMALLYSARFLKGSWLEHALYLCILLISIMLINGITVNVVRMIVKLDDVTMLYDASHSLELRILMLAETKFLYFMVSNLLLAVRRKKEYTFTLSERILSAVFFGASFFMSISLWIMSRTYPDLNPLIYLCTIGGLFVMNVLWYYFHQKRGMENLRKRNMEVLEVELMSQKQPQKVNSRKSSVFEGLRSGSE